MTTVKNRYPLSTSDGNYIPMEVVRTYSCLSLAFATGSSTAAKDVPDSVDIFSIFSDQDCYIQFAASAASAGAVVDGTEIADGMIIPANILVSISAPIDKKSFAIRGLTSAGTALINFLETWSALSLQSQITRR